ncbi:ABC transporter permease subunit [Thermococcus sp. SY098]|uniref:ABC transporter permease subunit n=1 Tax=Thermococcus sp. SY098 TaxID=3111325 RepID=UPI002D788AEA|nr:ABC transporter permease subunit [Thermococcus sp. SY098]WRS52793.1 ABC transporter permease subunit [Thermococcus sp. SY098]
MNPILNVAAKDIQESIRSKRLVITLAFFVLAGVGMAYWIKNLMMNLSVGGGGLADEQLLSNAVRGNLLSSAKNFLAILSMLIGADAINREIESGTIKATLGHPIYRDQFLLGKLLGRAVTVMFGFAIFAVVSTASMLIIGIPTSSGVLFTFIKPLPFFIIFSLVYLSLGMLISTVIKKPSTAIIIAVIFPVFLEIVYPMLVSMIIAFKTISSGATSPEAIQEMVRKVYTFLMIQPGFHLENINNAIFYGMTSSQIASAAAFSISLQAQAPPYLEALGLAWKNIVLLFVMMLIPFALAYLRFMKADLR